MNTLTSDEIESLFRRFCDSSLPKKEWTHQAHLTVGLVMVKRYPFHDAICRMKSGIILLNNFHGTVNDGTHGYHETLTIFWLRIIDAFICLNPTINENELVNYFLNSNLSGLTVPGIFYDEKLMSAEYRAVLVEPKLRITLDVLQAIILKQL